MNTLLFSLFFGLNTLVPREPVVIPERSTSVVLPRTHEATPAPKPKTKIKPKKQNSPKIIPQVGKKVQKFLDPEPKKKKKK